MRALYWKARCVCRFWKEFFRLSKMGYSPFRLLRLCVADGYWRACIGSGNGDLYLMVEGDAE